MTSSAVPPLDPNPRLRPSRMNSSGWAQYLAPASPFTRTVRCGCSPGATRSTTPVRRAISPPTTTTWCVFLKELIPADAVSVRFNVINLDTIFAFSATRSTLSKLLVSCPIFTQQCLSQQLPPGSQFPASLPPISAGFPYGLSSNASGSQAVYTANFLQLAFPISVIFCL